MQTTTIVMTSEPRYELRPVTEPGGQAPRQVWALFCGKQRIHEVHALTNFEIVRADAEEYIRAARVAG